MKHEAFLVALFPLVTYQSNSQGLDLALAFLKNLSLTVIRPNFVCNMSPTEAKIIYGTLGDLPVGFGPPVMGQNVVFCADDHEPWYFQSVMNSSASNAVGLDWLVLGKADVLASLFNVTHLPINKRVLYVNWETGVIGEKYFIQTSNMNKDVHNILANFTQVSGKTEINWIMDRCALRRRSNLKGTNMTASVGTVRPYIYIRPEHFYDAKWFKDNKGLMLSKVPRKFIGGPYVSVMFMLESDMNLTLSSIMRRDNLVGLPKRKKGGKITWDGRIGDLLAGGSDMMVAPVSYTIERAGILDYLTLTTAVTTAIHVGKNAGNEEEAWLTYVLPLRQNSWVALMANTLAIVLFLLSLQFLGMRALKFKQILQGSIGDVWMIFFSYFGRPSSSDFWWSFQLTKMLLLAIFLSGILSNMSYRASLTSELSVRKQILPFTTPEDFYHSEFQFSK